MNVTIEPLRTDDYESAIDAIKRSIVVSLGKIYPQQLTDEFCHKYDLENFK